MIKDVLRFYYSCAGYAFQGVYGVASAVSGFGAMVLGTVGMLPLPPFWKGLTSMSAAPFVIFATIFLLIFCVRIVIAPYRKFQDEKQARELAEAKLVPVLSIELADASPQLIGGRTVEATDGSRQTVFNQIPPSLSSILVRNIGQSPVRNCRVKLVALEVVSGAKELSFTEAVVLPWDFKNPERHLSCNLDPGEARRVWISKMTRSNHAYLVRDMHVLPEGYRHLLGSPGTFRLTLSVSADQALGIVQDVEVEVHDREAVPHGQSQSIRILAGA